MEKRICLQNFHALPTAASCFGDSGGPIVVCEDDRIVVIGVSSWGQGHCREEGVSVFVDVAMYVPWIRSKISEGNNKLLIVEMPLLTWLLQRPNKFRCSSLSGWL